MVITTKYDDSHLYIFSKWVIDLIPNLTNMISIKHELIPYLTKKQFRNLKDDNTIPKEAKENKLKLAYSMSSSFVDENDFVKVYAYFAKDAYCKRSYTLPLYGEINREVFFFF